jgi:hypothetical protein
LLFFRLLTYISIPAWYNPTGSVLVVGCILAYRTRDLDPQYGESKQLGKEELRYYDVTTEKEAKSSHSLFLCILFLVITVVTAFAMYNIAFTGLITILIISLVELDQISRIVVQTVSVLWGSCFCSLAFVLPRLLQVQKDHQLAKSQTSGLSKSLHATASFTVTDGRTFRGLSRFSLSSSGAPTDSMKRIDSQRSMSNSEADPYVKVEEVPRR